MIRVVCLAIAEDLYVVAVTLDCCKAAQLAVAAPRLGGGQGVGTWRCCSLLQALIQQLSKSLSTATEDPLPPFTAGNAVECQRKCNPLDLGPPAVTPGKILQRQGRLQSTTLRMDEPLISQPLA